jgi:hypothetical protein
MTRRSHFDRESKPWFRSSAAGFPIVSVRCALANAGRAVPLPLAGSTQAVRNDEACFCIAAAAKCFPAWNQMATPAGSNSFYAVAAFGLNEVWAVGSRYDGINDRPLAEHFDGAR